MKVLHWLNNQPYILVFLATLFWAGNAIAGKTAVGHISPFLLTSLRWSVAVLILLPFSIQYLRSDWVLVRSRLFFMFILGTIGFTVFNNLMYLALTTTSAINVAIIQSSLPLFVFILNMVVFAVKVNKYQAIGFPITIVGVLTITFQGSLSLLINLNLNMGDILMVIAVVSYAVYSVFLNNKPNLHWLSTVTLLALAALISSIPFAVFESVNGNLTLPDLTGLSVVLYTALFASLGAQVCWIRSIELIGSNSTSVFINLVPLFGSFLAVILLGEKFHIFHAIGILLIFTGIYLSQFKSKE